jgi:hypothetical protein
LQEPVSVFACAERDTVAKGGRDPTLRDRAILTVFELYMLSRVVGIW